MSDGSLQLGDRAGLNVVDLGNEDLTFGGGGLAFSVPGGVWVSGLELLLIALKIVHGVLLETTIAALRLFVTINQLLLGEGEELSGLLEMSSLDGSGGREGPA